MSGARLCSLVAELGYEGAGKLDPDSFEWPFQYDDARPILDWICSSLRPSNVLSLPELSLYEQFQREGKLLEGEDLDQAYDSISAFSSRRNNQEAVFGAEESIKEVRDATLAHKAEALELQRQLRRLQTQYDLLTGQSSALIQGRRARVAATSAVTGQITAIEDSISARNLQMNGVLGKLASTSQELAHYHSGEEDGIYLAYSDFHAYLAGDSACTKELNQWFVKQLDTGPYRLVAEEGKSKCSWCFETATTQQPAFLHYAPFPQDRDLYLAGDLYDNHHLVAPAVILLPRRRVSSQAKVGQEPKRTSSKEEHNSKTDAREFNAPKSCPTPMVKRRTTTPKPVDEDLYKVSPHLLSVKSTKKRGGGFGCLSRCFLPTHVL